MTKIRTSKRLKDECPRAYAMFLELNKVYLNKHKNFDTYSFLTKFGRYYEFLKTAYSNVGIEFYIYLNHDVSLYSFEPKIIEFFINLERTLVKIELMKNAEKNEPNNKS